MMLALRYLSRARLLLGVMACLLASCASNRVQAWKESPPRQKQWADVCKDAALLSAVVYRGTAYPLVDDLPDFEAMLKKDGWQRKGVCDHTNGEGRGLYFEVWENATTKPRKIIFAFRGTEFTSAPDWKSNFRWFRFVRRSPDQYDVARQEALPLIAKYFGKSEGAGDRPMIISTGHSLGGGIAEGIFYAAATKVDHCIAFDPSPVTGYYDLEKEVRTQYLHLKHRDSFPQYRIIRAHENGEILQPVRNFLGAFYKRDSLIQSIEFQSKKHRNSIVEHSMEVLAMNILDAANQKYEPPPDVATKVTPAECPSYVEDALRRPNKRLLTAGRN